MQCISSRLFLAILLSLALSERVSAGIVLSFAPAGPFTAGNAGTVDLLIHADPATTQVLDGFFVNVSLTPTGGSPANGLTFAAQTDSQLVDPDYVFFGRSLSGNTGTPVSVADTATTLAGSDFSDDGSGPPPLAGNPNPFTLVDAATNPNQLLLRMNIFAVLAGTYDIAVELTGASQATDFVDDTFTSIPFSRTPMSITVNAAAAVPEPATGFICGLAAVSAILWKRRRSLTPENPEV
jgi:hypothetical protein